MGTALDAKTPKAARPRSPHPHNRRSKPGQWRAGTQVEGWTGCVPEERPLEVVVSMGQEGMGGVGTQAGAKS